MPAKRAPTYQRPLTLPIPPASPPPLLSENPWNPPSPTTHLRQHFRHFTSSQNTARMHRGEAPFCTATNRDKAFEKLLRLSRGEEEISWHVDTSTSQTDRAYGGGVSWYERMGWVGEMGAWEAGEGEECVEVEEDVEDEEVVVKGKEKEVRKDSKDVGGGEMQGGNGWRRLVGRFGGRQLGNVDVDVDVDVDVEMQDGSSSGASTVRENSCEHVENVKDVQGSSTVRENSGEHLDNVEDVRSSSTSLSEHIEDVDDVEK